MRSLTRDQLAGGAFDVAHTGGAPIPPVTILQVGDGNFLRGFVDWMVDVANGQGLTNAGVAIAQPLDQGISGLLKAQDNLYTVLLRGIGNGREVESRRVVSCVADALNPYADWARMVELASSPALRFFISNTTEAGIADREEPYTPGTCQDSFPAKVAALLHARYTALGGTADSGLVFLPCELIEANGSNLKRIVLAHAKRWGLEAGFADWIETHNHFLNTLVDRIVPGYPRDEAAALTAKWGYEDKLAVAAEPFHVWVIEGPAHLADELPLHKAGLDVVWTDDLQPYRTRKVRILNGAHTASALAAYCAGLDTVKSMMDDPAVSAYLNKVMFEEIVPYVPLPEAERQDYARTIMERFGNPYIRHELISITLNSVSKWQVRVLPSLKDAVVRNGRAPAGLSFSLAALLRFYRGTLADGAYTGTREAGSYPISDNAEVIAAMSAAWAAHAGDAKALVAAVLSDTRLWKEDLTAIPGLAARVADSLAAIEAKGMKAAMADLVADLVAG
ncbi:tagaturonate reductase [Azospirillum thiophilum]|uniref:Tagaturonate reductase n=1 Tax=Azospirillum thiophilum TaxID=528244 RepID=A0AAC9EXX9_9PROT|nr:tagaturonate reductase [Azospirillum thiophilum]ALG72656.1 tagaturonate reductase [Azospirillum thiophilum]KJR64427.1 tagaturonate reductase [Azospirillum thiophilum]